MLTFPCPFFVPGTYLLLTRFIVLVVVSRIMESSQLLRCLEGLYVPDKSCPAPPRRTTNFSKKQNVVYHLQIPASNYPSGSLLWLPWRSYDFLRLYRSIAPATSWTVNGFAYSIRSFDLCLLDMGFSNTGVVDIPLTGRLVSVAPSLSGQYSTGRVTSGVLTVRSTTVSTTVAALSGIIGGAAISDMRGLHFGSQAALKSHSELVKDGHHNHPISDGMTAIVGADIPEEYRSINYNDIRDTSSYSSTLLLNWNSGVVGGPYFVGFNGFAVTYANLHYTPTNVRIVASLTPTNLNAGDLAPEVFPRLRFNKGFVPYTQVNPNFTAAYVHMHVLDVFVAIDEQGATETLMTDASYLVPSAGAGYGASNFEIIHNIRRPRQNPGSEFGFPRDSLPVGTAGLGRYVGSFVVWDDITYDATTGSEAFVINPVRMPLRLFVDIPNGFSDNVPGPARFFTWEGVGAGQNITISGGCVVEGETTNSLEPFTSGEIREVYDPAFLPIVSALWNSDLVEFSRMFKHSDYMSLIEKFGDASWLAEVLKQFMSSHHASQYIIKNSAFGQFLMTMGESATIPDLRIGSSAPGAVIPDWRVGQSGFGSVIGSLAGSLASKAGAELAKRGSSALSHGLKGALHGFIKGHAACGHTYNMDNMIRAGILGAAEEGKKLGLSADECEKCACQGTMDALNGVEVGQAGLLSTAVSMLAPGLVRGLFNSIFGNTTGKSASYGDLVKGILMPSPISMGMSFDYNKILKFVRKANTLLDKIDPDRVLKTSVDQLRHRGLKRLSHEIDRRIQ